MSDSSTPTAEQINHARRKIALDIAENLEPEIGEGYDVDDAAQQIELLLPHTYAEAQVLMDELLASKPGRARSRKPSFFDQLRKAVNATDGMSIQCVVEAAVAKIELNAELLAIVEGYLALVDLATPPPSFADIDALEKRAIAAVAKAKGTA